MGIGVKETQNLIRRVAASSHKDVVGLVQIDPQEAGMATGPRIRRRSLDRPGGSPEYISSESLKLEGWQQLDNDVYKLLHLRGRQFASLPTPPSHQFIMEVEEKIGGGAADYEPGTFLGLMRLAADLDETRETLVTSSEKSSLNALARRLTTGRREGEYFDAAQVELYQNLLKHGDAITGRGMADLLRFMARAAHMPLLGNIQEAPALCLDTFLQVTDLAVRFNQESRGKLEFQVSPLDVFMAARSVLFNRSVGNPTFAMIRELVIDTSGLYHEDLQEWLQSVGIFGSDLTVLMPPRLFEEGFALNGQNLSALDLVSVGGSRLSRTPLNANAGLHTLGDAIIHRIQRQDMHKDHQIQTLLDHFNGLLKAERRSASRVQVDRQQSGFDYMQAIRRAGEAADGAKTGFFPVLKPTASPSQEVSHERIEAPFPPPSRDQLKEWDASLQAVRKRLTTKSPVFRALVTQLARVRGMDTALVFGLTPGGNRCLGRFMRLLQNPEARKPHPMPIEDWQKLEARMEEEPAGFHADLESLLLALYGFRGRLDEVQFRYRDRLRAETPAHGAHAENLLGDGTTLDESMIGLLVGLLRLELGVSTGEDAALMRQRRESGRSEEPTLAYAAFLQLLVEKQGKEARGDVESARRMVWNLQPEWVAAWSRKRLDLGKKTPRPRLPGLGRVVPRSGWKMGCEQGFMEEIQEIMEQAGQDLEKNMIVRLTEIQPYLDSIISAVESDKLRLAQEKQNSAR